MIKKRITLIFSLVGLVLVVTIGTSFAYLRATRTQTDKNKISTASCLQIDFVGEDIINIPNAYPIRDEVGLSQTPYKFTISNVCSQNIEVSLGFESLPGSTLPLNYVKGIMAKEGHLADTTIAFLNSYPNSTPQNNGTAKLMLTDSIPGLQSKTYEYTMWIDYNVTASDISPNDVLNGKIIATYVMKTANSFTKYCYTDDYEPGMTMTAGTEYVNGQYTYHYLEEFNYLNEWQSISNGWGVVLTDSVTNGGASTDPVTSEVCTFINDIPVTSANAMYYNSKATSIDLSKFNTSNITNMGYMFVGTTATLNVSGFDTSNVTSMNSTFYNISATSLDLSNFNTSKVVDMRAMFYKAAVTELDLRSFDTSNVTDMMSMFYNSKVESLDLSSFNTSNVTEMSGMFANIPAETLDLSNFDTSSAIAMRSMFNGSNVKNLDLSSFDTSNVENMFTMFRYANTQTIDLSSFDTSKVTNMAGMFADCSNLTTIYASDSYVTTAVTADGQNEGARNMFGNAANLKGGAGTTYDVNYVHRDRAHIDGGTSNPGYFTYKNNPKFNGRCYTSDYIPGTAMLAGKTFTYGQYTYHFLEEYVGNTGWQSMNSGWGVVLTDSATNGGASTLPVYSQVCTYVNDIPVTSAKSMYYNSHATSIDLSNFDTSNINNMSIMFRGTTASTLDLSNFDTSNVTNMESLFLRNESSTIILGNNFNTSKVTNMKGMFQLSQATSIDLSSFDTSNVTSMMSMFYSSKFQSLDVSSFDTSKVTEMSGMFANIAATTLDLSNFNTSNVTSMRSMFNGAKVTTLDVSSFDTSNVVNMLSMFRGTTASTLDLSSFDTSKVENMSAMFAQCTNLTTIYASNSFVTTALLADAQNAGSTNMFGNAANLVGGAGTTYDHNYTNKERARIDGGTSNPGYFTYKAAPSN